MSVRSAFAALGIAAAISGWWYAGNLRSTGSISGLMQDAALRHMPLADRIGHATEVNWLRALDSTFFSHIWIGGWSFLQLRSWIYHSFAILAVLAVIGLAVAWIRATALRDRLFALTVIYALFCVGLAYHVLITFLANGISSSGGWYLCAVIVPEAVLAGVGLRALAPGVPRLNPIGLVAAAFALTDLYGMLFVALPYYHGLIGHEPGGALESFHLTRLAETGMGEVLRRMAANKPGFVQPWGVALAGCAYITATIAPAVFALRSPRRTQGFEA